MVWDFSYIRKWLEQSSVVPLSPEKLISIRHAAKRHNIPSIQVYIQTSVHDDVELKEFYLQVGKVIKTVPLGDIFGVLMTGMLRSTQT